MIFLPTKSAVVVVGVITSQSIVGIIRVVGGVGSYLKGLARAALPLVKRGAKSVGKEAARASAKIIDDVVNENTPFREALSQRVRESGGNLKRKATQVLVKMMMTPDEQKEVVGGGWKKGRSEYKKLKTVQKAQSDSYRGAGKKKKKQSVTKKKKKATVAKDIFDS